MPVRWLNNPPLIVNEKLLNVLNRLPPWSSLGEQFLWFSKNYLLRFHRIMLLFEKSNLCFSDVLIKEINDMALKNVSHLSSPVRSAPWRSSKRSPRTPRSGGQSLTSVDSRPWLRSSSPVTRSSSAWPRRPSRTLPNSGELAGRSGSTAVSGNWWVYIWEVVSQEKEAKKNVYSDDFHTVYAIIFAILD